MVSESFCVLLHVLRLWVVCLHATGCFVCEKMNRYEIFVHDFKESFPGQNFKGQGEATIKLELLCGKSVVWKAAAASIRVRDVFLAPCVVVSVVGCVSCSRAAAD